MAHPKKYSQEDVSGLLGYKKGQFVSNIERAKCSIPISRIPDICRILGIEAAPLKEAIIKDFSETIEAAYEKRLKELKHDASVNA